MVSPVQDSAVGGAVEILDDVSGRLGKIECLEVEVHQARVKILKTQDNIVAAHVVVRVPEDLDVWVQGFQGMLGVLWSVRDGSGGRGQRPYDRVHCNVLVWPRLAHLRALANSHVRAWGTSLYTIT